MKIQAAIFDMDGTLVDSVYMWGDIWSQLGEKYFGNKTFSPDNENASMYQTMLMPEAMERIHKHYGMGESAKALYDEVNRMCEAFYAHEVQLKKGAKELLAHYRKSGVKICLASASPMSWIELSLDRCGIREYFDEILTCLDFGCGKGSPDIFLAALKKLGTPSAETWVFEDSLTALRTAGAIGLPTVGVYDQYTPRQDVIAATATEYLGPGEDFTRYI